MKKLLKKVLPRSAQNVIRRMLYGRFYVLQQETDGLMSPDHYERIYNEVKKLPDMDIVEIGGAGGTGSIAICWALKEQGRKSKLVVVEKCEGGSRTQYGGKKENLARFERNILDYGVSDYIVLFPQYMTFENGREVVSLVKTPQIAALMIDADGWLHRDFHFFWSKLIPGGLIVIDDYEQGRDAKHDLTFHLLNKLIEWGLFERAGNVGSTIFGRKPANGDISKLNLDECQKIVEEVSQKYKVVFDKAGVSNR